MMLSGDAHTTESSLSLWAGEMSWFAARSAGRRAIMKAPAAIEFEGVDYCRIPGGRLF